MINLYSLQGFAPYKNFVTASFDDAQKEVIVAKHEVELQHTQNGSTLTVDKQTGEELRNIYLFETEKEANLYIKNKIHKEIEHLKDLIEKLQSIEIHWLDAQQAKDMLRESALRR